VILKNSIISLEIVSTQTQVATRGPNMNYGHENKNKTQTSHM